MNRIIIFAFSLVSLLSFQSEGHTTDFYELGDHTNATTPIHTDAHEFIPVRQTNLVALNLVIDGASRKYLAYDGNPGGSQVRLYYSDTVQGPWVAYSGNPIFQGGGNIYRWPSPVWDGTKIHMIIDDQLNTEKWDDGRYIPVKFLGDSSYPIRCNGRIDVKPKK